MKSGENVEYCLSVDEKIKKGTISAVEWQKICAEPLLIRGAINQNLAVIRIILASKNHLLKMPLEKNKIYVKIEKGKLAYFLIGKDGKPCTGKASWRGKLNELSSLLEKENIHKLMPVLIDKALKNGHISISLDEFIEEVCLQLRQFLEIHQDSPNKATARKSAKTILEIMEAVHNMKNGGVLNFVNYIYKIVNKKIIFDLNSVSKLINKDWIRIPKISFEPADMEFFLIYQHILEMALQLDLPSFIKSKLDKNIVIDALITISNILKYTGQRNQSPLGLLIYLDGKSRSYIPKEYKLCLISSEKQEYISGKIIQQDKETKEHLYFGEGNIYIGKTSDGKLRYIIVPPDGENSIDDTITAEELGSQIPDPVTVENLKPLFGKILDITLNRGHTFPDHVNAEYSMRNAQYSRVTTQLSITSDKLLKVFHGKIAAGELKQESAKLEQKNDRESKIRQPEGPNSQSRPPEVIKPGEIKNESSESEKLNQQKNSAPEVSGSKTQNGTIYSVRELKECKEHEVSQPIYEVRDNKHTPQEDSQDIHESNKQRDSGKESVVHSISKIKTAELVEDVAEQIKSLQAEQKNSEREILKLLDSKEKYKLNRGEQRAKKANIDYEIQVSSRSLSRTEATKRGYNDQIQQLGLWGKAVEYFRRYIGDRLGSPSSLFSKIKDCDEALRRNQEILREQGIRLQNVDINLKDLEGIILNKEKEISDAIAKQKEKKEDLIELIKKDNENVFKAIISEVKDWKQLDETSQKNIKALVEKALQGADCQRPIHQSVVSKISEKITAALYDKWSHIEEDEQQRKGVYIEGTKHVMARFFGSFSRGETLTCKGLKDAINTIKSQQSPAPVIAKAPSGNH